MFRAGESGAIKPIPHVSSIVTDDATLSEFTGPSDEADAEHAEGEAVTTESDTAGSTDSDDEHTLERNTGATQSTYAWGEYTCSRCETATERVWREEGAVVCPECKSW